MTRRQFLHCAAALAGALGLRAARAQASPALPGTARILIGAPPGGGGDLMARRLADKLKGVYAANVVVENKAGAGGLLAIAALREAAEDGATLLLAPSSFLSIYPYTYKTLPYNPVTDFAPVSMVCWANHGLAVGPLVPATVKTLADFIAWAKANPKDATYGSPAPGSIPHLIGATLAHLSGAPLRHVPYRGSAQALTDLRGGTLAAHSSPVGQFLPHLASGQLRVLAVSGDARSSFAPQVPTYKEQGFAIIAREWYGLFLHGKASAETVARAATAVRGVVTQAEFKDAIAQFGLDAAVSSPKELADMVRADNEEWRDHVKKIGFTAES
jgi:tripartite-type tricarboxylate transporter receptor subunit TctC